MSTQDTQPLANPIEMPKSNVYSAFCAWRDGQNIHADHYFGKYMTFLDSLFEEGPRLKAIKDSFRNIYWDEVDFRRKSAASIFCGLSRSIGDRETADCFREVYGVHPAWFETFDQYLEGCRPTVAGSDPSDQ